MAKELEVMEMKAPSEDKLTANELIDRQEDMLLVMCLIVAVLINVILIITNFWQWDNWYQLLTLSVFSIGFITYTFMGIAIRIIDRKKKSRH